MSSFRVSSVIYTIFPETQALIASEKHKATDTGPGAG
jgi:hypothetical protein